MQLPAQARPLLLRIIGDVAQLLAMVVGEQVTDGAGRGERPSIDAPTSEPGQSSARTSEAGETPAAVHLSSTTKNNKPRVRAVMKCRKCGALGFRSDGCGKTHNVETSSPPPYQLQAPVIGVPVRELKPTPAALARRALIAERRKPAPPREPRPEPSPTPRAEPALPTPRATFTF